MSPMNNRLMRPRASGGFDPTSISGCICNLDASVPSSLWQSSDGTIAAAAQDDPVGYWGDLSGSGSHARQTVATGSRPFLKLSDQNGRPGLFFDGSNDFLSAAVSGFNALTNATVLYVWKAALAASADADGRGFIWGFGNVGNASGSYPANAALAASSETSLFAGETIVVQIRQNAIGFLGSDSYSRPANTAQLLGFSFGSAGTGLSVNGSSVPLNLASTVTTSTASGPSTTGYTLDNDIHISGRRANGTLASAAMAMTLHQFLVYNRILTSGELATIWNAMQTKWGIT